MPNFLIKPATHADAEMLGHIGVATFVESYTDDIDGAAMVAHCTREHAQTRYETYLAEPSTGCWLAVHSDTHAPVGYALTCTPDLPVATTDSDIELKRIYVLSQMHGQGVALALLEAAIVHAKANGRARLLLGTYEANHRAMAFYTKQGFEMIGTRQFNVGGKIYDDIVMAKPLLAT